MSVNIKRLIISVTIPLLLGSIAGIATSRNIENWYNQLNKPSFAPPNEVFGPVWTLLYILIGVALYRYWQSTAVNENEKKKGYILFGAQLLLNFLWSFIFFEFKQLGLAFFEIILMWIAILLTIVVFSRADKGAARLLVPYIAWVSFACVLNYAYWTLNR